MVILHELNLRHSSPSSPIAKALLDYKSSENVFGCCNGQFFFLSINKAPKNHLAATTPHQMVERANL